MILTAAVIGISAVLFKDRKKGGCASCPYYDGCSSKKDCPSADGGPGQ